VRLCVAGANTGRRRKLSEDPPDREKDLSGGPSGFYHLAVGRTPEAAAATGQYGSGGPGPSDPGSVRFGVAGSNTGRNQGPGLPARTSGWLRTNFRSGQRPAPTLPKKSRSQSLYSTWIWAFLCQDLPKLPVEKATSRSRSIAGRYVIRRRSDSSPHSGNESNDYPQNFHHGRAVEAFKAVRARSWWSWSICRFLAKSSLSWAATRSLSWSTRSLWCWSVEVSAMADTFSKLMNHFPPTLLPVSRPLVNRRLTVFWETPRAIAASGIESSMTLKVNHLGNRCLPKFHKRLTRFRVVSETNHSIQWAIGDPPVDLAA